MTSKRVEELMAMAKADKDITGQPGVGPIRVLDEPFAPGPAADTGVKVKSLRLEVDVHDRIQALADASGTDFSKLVRRWVFEGLARESGQDVDPVAEVEKILELAGHLARTLRREAA